MSFLFKIQDRAVFPNPETIMIYPFNEIWERDISPKKEVAMQEFAYIEFMISMMKSNPYREYAEEMKELKIRQEVIVEIGWQPDELVQAGMDKLVELQTEGSLTYRYWIASKIALEKQIKFFEEVDINERNPKTFAPIYKPKDVPDAVANAEKVLTTINGLKTKVDEELFESSKMRSDKTISPFADPNSLRNR